MSICTSLSLLLLVSEMTIGAADFSSGRWIGCLQCHHRTDIFHSGATYHITSTIISANMSEGASPSSSRFNWNLTCRADIQQFIDQWIHTVFIRSKEVLLTSQHNEICNIISFCYDQSASLGTFCSGVICIFQLWYIHLVITELP